MLPTTNKTKAELKLEAIERINLDVERSVRRIALKLREYHTVMWGGDIPDSIAAASAVNSLSLSTGKSVTEIFAARTSTAQFCATAIPELAAFFKNPPVDKSKALNAKGLIDLDLLRSALKAAHQKI